MARDTRHFVVLETSGPAQQLQMLMEFVVDNNPGTGLKKLTKVATVDLIHKIVIQAVNWRMSHNPYGCYEKAILESLFGERDKDYTKKEKQIYQALSNDPQWTGIVAILEKQISEHIGIDTYQDWRVIKVGGLVGLAEGEDYRVTEYYRLCPEKKENEEAVLTLNASNPINYLLGQFKHMFGEKLTYLVNQQPSFFANQNPMNHVLVSHKDIFTQERMRSIQRHGWEMVKSDPEAVSMHLRWIYNNTEEYITAMFLDTLVTMYPMIELDIATPRFNSMGMAQLGVWNMEKFREEFLQRVISAFGFSYFSTYLKKDKTYKLEFYNRTNILSVFEKPEYEQSKIDMNELLRSFIAGDRLPVDQARKAQDMYEEMARRGEIE